jgi:hypothetical protein
MDRIVKSILIGTVLGDGHLTPPSGNKSQLYAKYDDKYIEYLHWLHTQLKPIGVSAIKPHKGFHQHRFRTRSSREIFKLRNYFYPLGKKIIPANISFVLRDPLSLAIWYMDDGTLDFREKYHRNASIATFCFSYRENKLLANALMKNFGIEARVHLSTMRGKKYYRLYIVSKSFDRFIDHIKAYIVPCMLYKIP